MFRNSFPASFPEECVKSVQSYQLRHQSDVNGVVLVPLFLTWDRFFTLFWCFHRWIWISKSQLKWESIFCQLTIFFQPTIICLENGCLQDLVKTYPKIVVFELSESFQYKFPYNLFKEKEKTNMIINSKQGGTAKKSYNISSPMNIFL